MDEIMRQVAGDISRLTLLVSRPSKAEERCFCFLVYAKRGESVPDRTFGADSTVVVGGKHGRSRGKCTLKVRKNSRTTLLDGLAQGGIVQYYSRTGKER